MQKTFPFLLAGQLLAAVAFVVTWSKGFPAVSTVGARVSTAYGVTMALFGQAGTLITCAVQPMPASLMTKWFIAGLVQGVLLGVVVFLVGKPGAVSGGPKG
jgi:hypothetical protein